MNDLRRLILPSPDSLDITTPNPLISVLLGLQPPSAPQSYVDTEPKLSSVEWLDPNLNESQKAAVQLALNNPELALV